MMVSPVLSYLAPGGAAVPKWILLHPWKPQESPWGEGDICLPGESPGTLTIWLFTSPSAVLLVETGAAMSKPDIRVQDAVAKAAPVPALSWCCSFPAQFYPLPTY